MHDDTLLNKAVRIERSVARAKAEYALNPDTFAQDVTRQDATILNIQRACEAALHMGQHLVRRERLGVPQSARDVFELPHTGGWLAQDLAEAMKRMVGFRNIAVHDYGRCKISQNGLSNWAFDSRHIKPLQHELQLSISQDC